MFLQDEGTATDDGMQTPAAGGDTASTDGAEAPAAPADDANAGM